ncbi:MAG TPA: hypothetical protein V6D11_24400 [Waterburya sp.]
MNLGASLCLDISNVCDRPTQPPVYFLPTLAHTRCPVSSTLLAEVS